MQIYNPILFDSAGTGPAVSWEQDLELPGAEQMQFIKKVLQDRRAYPNLVPDLSLIAGDAGYNDSHVAALKDQDGSDCVLVYTPTGQALTLNLARFYAAAGNDTIEVSWFSPLDGSYQFPTVAGAEDGHLGDVFVPPQEDSHNDWVLILERRDT